MSLVREHETKKLKEQKKGLDIPTSNLNGVNFDNLLNNLYYTSKNAFSSPRILYHAAKKIQPHITLKDVTTYLEKQNTYTSFKKPRYHINRRVTEKGSVDSNWQIDTFFLINLKKYNSNYHFRW